MIVVDATVLVKLLTREPGAEQARARIIVEDQRIAPDWIKVEVANALVRKVGTVQLPADAVPAAMAAIPALLTDLPDSLDLLDEAVRLASALGHGVYDCLYLALARQHRVPLVTHDAKFVQAAQRGGQGDLVELLA